VPSRRGDLSEKQSLIGEDNPPKPPKRTQKAHKPNPPPKPNKTKTGGSPPHSKKEKPETPSNFQKGGVTGSVHSKGDDLGLVWE